MLNNINNDILNIFMSYLISLVILSVLHIYWVTQHGQIMYIHDTIDCDQSN